MADSTVTTAGQTATTTDADSLMQLISTVNTDGIMSVYSSGFILTFAVWALGMKIGVALNVIRKA